MPKLPDAHQFLDLSDYGRPLARVIVRMTQNTWVTPIHLTLGFIACGLGAIYAICEGWYTYTLVLLLLKSVLDAADGELARANGRPSYIGRYLDSVADITLNFCIIMVIGHLTNSPVYWTILAFISIQIQGTLYNYYYVILRNRHRGDRTSRIIEREAPKALHGESQFWVNILFTLHKFSHGIFDKLIYFADRDAIEAENYPNWFMTSVSVLGLGFQLLLIGVMVLFQLKEWIIPFFIAYSMLVVIFVSLRKLINRSIP